MTEIEALERIIRHLVIIQWAVVFTATQTTLKGFSQIWRIK